MKHYKTGYTALMQLRSISLNDIKIALIPDLSNKYVVVTLKDEILGTLDHNELLQLSTQLIELQTQIKLISE